MCIRDRVISHCEDLSIIHGGIVNKTGGQIGAGAARFGTDHYVKAAYAFLDKYGK
mgnify:CR=1 FL=1